MMLSLDMIGPSPAIQMGLGWSVNLSIINRNRRLGLPGSVLNNAGEGLRIEAGTANQGAVYLFFRHQSLGVLRLDTATVEDAHVVRDFIAESVCCLFADGAVRVSGHFRSCSLSGANRPDGFVSYNNGAATPSTNLAKSVRTLAT